MRIAQRLYEGVDIGGETVGLITYMRTDSVHAVAARRSAAARELIGEQYGADYLPEAPRVYKTKAKNAQEAHEAIRPTDLFRRPGEVAKQLDDDQRRLYELIWKRTSPARWRAPCSTRPPSTSPSADGKTVLRATGSVVVFDGFLKLYHEDRDEPREDERRG